MIHPRPVDAVLGPLAVQGHLIPLLLGGDRPEAHVGEAGQWGTTKSSNPVDAQCVNRFLLQNLDDQVLRSVCAGVGEQIRALWGVGPGPYVVNP